MKLAELEQEARTEMVVEERKAEDKAEEFRQKVITWFSAKLDLDEAELQDVLSVGEARYKIFKRELAGTREAALKAIHLNISKHKPIFFAVDEAMGQLHMVSQYMVGHKARPVYDLGVALVVAADEWEEEQEIDDESNS